VTAARGVLPVRTIAAAWPVLVPALAVGLFYARGFGGFWLGDDLSNMVRAYEAANADQLWSQTWSQLVAPVLQCWPAKLSFACSARLRAKTRLM